MQAAEYILIALNFELELLVRRTHVLHFLIDHLLHFKQISLILLIHLIEVVVQDLKRLWKGINFVCHFIAQIADPRYVFENLLLLVFEVLIQTLNVS